MARMCRGTACAAGMAVLVGILASARASSPVAHYSFDGALWDATGNGFEPTSHRPPGTEGHSMFGQAGQFESDDRTRMVIDPTPLSGLTEATFAFWIKPESWDGSPRFFQQAGDDDCRFHAPSRIEFNMNHRGFREGDPTTLAPLGEWTHLAAVVEPDGGLLRLYVNGDPIWSTPSDGMTSTEAPFLIGAKEDKYTSWQGDHFDGLMDEFFIVDKALTAGEIQDLMANNTLPGWPEPTPPPPPVASVEITAYIDGRDRLIIRGGTMQWDHLDWAAVGRHGGLNEPTIITTTSRGQTILDGVEWVPQWSAEPPDEIRSPEISSVFTGLVPLLDAGIQTVELEVLSARREVWIVEQPSAANDYAVIVEFNDNMAIAADWYTIRLDYVPEPGALSLLAVAGLGTLARRRRTG